MATSHFFSNREIILPGAYSTIKSGIRNPAISLAFGNTLIIDTGSSGGPGGFFGGGAGINGTIKQGIDSHYTFDNVRDFRNFVRGGLWWLLGGPMFLPGGGATAGISSLTYIRAKTTVAAEITIPFGAQEDSDSDTNSTNDGEVVVQVRDEGFGGNAVCGDETRAKSTITVTNAGANGNQISIRVDGQLVAEYTRDGETIAQAVQALVTSVGEIGLAEVFSSNATQLVIYAPKGYGNDLNGLSPSISVTGSAAASAGTFSGGVEGTQLTRGYAAKVVEGELDEDKFIIQFWRGTFKGTDDAVSNLTPVPFDGLAELSTEAELVVQSPEIDTVQALVDWMQDTAGEGFLFNQYFNLKEYTIGSTTDEILPQDLSNNYVKAIGGSESASIDDLQDALDSIEDLTFDFIIADKWGDEARSAENLAILDFITNTMQIKPDFYVAGGSVEGEWNSGSTSSVSLAQAFDSQYVTLVHGGVKVTDIGNRAFKEYQSIYKAAAMLGREAGIAPQVPLTFKNIGVQGELHILKKKDQKLGLNAGVLMSKPDGGSFEVIKGVNTLQNNKFLVNPDGSTHSKQFARIERQLNKEIVFNAKASLLKKLDGTNRNTLSVQDVKTWTDEFLATKHATDLLDNLLISHRAVEVVRNQDAYEITYAFEPNTEISFLFFTGVAIDPSQK